MTGLNINENTEILGYHLTHKIGSGGYGQVWAAEAPGGLKKAVKIIFGYHDEKRAQAELKALERIKNVRHPFLLNLERIDICDGQLIVVSELADKSLADLFNEYRAADKPGIPREELLGYMRDAADALDYLSSEFRLQHLDIKPENLLLLSGHVKVADFGLVKDLKDASQSLMSGMTPTYAAPEMFDGRPAAATDQYSLAIVYQEMLTAARPFPGTTPAQLAAQHIHGRPNIQSLPTSDQAVIAKALAKKPGERFPSCAAMVDELLNRRSRKKTTRTRTRVRQAEDTQCKTVVFGNKTDHNATAQISDQMNLNRVEMENLAPPEFDPNGRHFRPTIIVGVGKTANQTVRNIKQRMVARFGEMDFIPSIQFLCIDCDRDDLTRLTLDGNGRPMATSETLAIPLRKPQEYRDKNGFSWLSRRWIYNIPRNLKTEGLRPRGGRGGP